MPFWKRSKKAEDPASKAKRLSPLVPDISKADIEDQRAHSPIQGPSSHGNPKVFSDLTPQQLENFKKDFGKEFKQVKVEKFGLFIFSDQPESNKDAIDIVAIHGLNGHYMKTWQSTTSSGDGVLWLRDILPHQIPQARIMSYGYDSSVVFSKSTEDISTFADGLLEDLVSRRQGQVEQRPIIFICHSLGGIVAKKAIIRAHEKSLYQTTLDAIKGIAFFGTPHRGSALADWSTLASNILRAASFGVNTQTQLSKDLKKNSKVLQEISKSFVERAKDLQLVSFYETEKMDFMNCRVVEEESAVLGFPDEVAIPIKGDHRTICRFEAHDEQKYRKVWTNLQNMAGSASYLGRTAEDIACLKALHTSNYISHKDRNPTAVPGTCQWLLNHEKYLAWRREQASSLLWLSADPGCGKSVLASYLVDNLKNAGNRLQVSESVCYFFFKDDSDEQNNSMYALCALLHQLYNSQPRLLKHATSEYTARGSSMFGQFDTLWNVLMKSATDTNSRDIIFVLDGLDECELQTRRLLLKSLSRLYKTSSKHLRETPFLKTIIASRPNNDIKAALDVLPTIRLRGEDEPEAISKDVNLVIQHSIEQAVFRGLPRSMLGDLELGLIQGADRASKKELLAILQSRDIYQIYHRLLEESSDQTQARKLLEIVVATARPLTLTEMSIALAIEPAHSTFKDLEDDIVHNFEERVKALCGNFIRIIRSTIYLVHQTAREFLLCDKTMLRLQLNQNLGQWQHSILLRDANRMLLELCVHYLTFLGIKINFAELDSFDHTLYAHLFVEYAGKYWTYHYIEASLRSNDSLQYRCVQLCNPNAPGFARWYGYHHAPDAQPKATNPATRHREVAMQLGLGQVATLIDRLEPKEIDWVDEEKEESSVLRSGCMGSSSKTSVSNLKVPSTKPSTNYDKNGVQQPHTISLGFRSSSPLTMTLENEQSKSVPGFK
ncbi:ankyrin repeat protein [Hyaloscypha finlandica]|nr:ankyrin repeat protein [Hyaloscypha finlandica]